MPSNWSPSTLAQISLFSTNRGMLVKWNLGHGIPLLTSSMAPHFLQSPVTVSATACDCVHDLVSRSFHYCSCSPPSPPSRTPLPPHGPPCHFSSILGMSSSQGLCPDFCFSLKTSNSPAKIPSYLSSPNLCSYVFPH